MGEPGSVAPAILCVGVTRSFGTRTALAPLDLEVAGGEVFGLVGANGGGKTTLLRLVAGVLAPDGGVLRVLGAPPHRRRDRIGYMPQGMALRPELTVAENLRGQAALMAAADPRGATAAMLEWLDLKLLAGRRAGELSGGQARLAQLGVALVHRPAVVLLDEPTVGLDPAVRQDVWDRIGAVAARGAAVIVSTHDLAEAERFSRLAFLAEGGALAVGAPAAICAAAEARASSDTPWSGGGLEAAVRALLRQNRSPGVGAARQ